MIPIYFHTHQEQRIGDREAAAAPEVAPEPRPALKKITYRKKDYRYKIKMGETIPAGYILYEFADLYGDKPIGYITADAKGLPKGDIGPVPE
jgi:hypothetical protein